MSTEAAIYFGGGGGGGMDDGSTPLTMVLSEETVVVADIVEVEVPKRISWTKVRNRLRGSSLSG